MEFITFIENNHKERELIFFYLQYTGNEEELKKFAEFIKNSTYQMVGDYSDFQINLDVKISEDAVNQHCKLDYGCYSSMFNKVTGVFKNPLILDDKLTSDEMGKMCDECLYGTLITEYFK